MGYWDLFTIYTISNNDSLTIPFVTYSIGTLNIRADIFVDVEPLSSRQLLFILQKAIQIFLHQLEISFVPHY